MKKIYIKIIFILSLVVVVKIIISYVYDNKILNKNIVYVSTKKDIIKNSEDEEIKETEQLKNIKRTYKNVAITFDDGPHPIWTNKLLDGLKKRNVKATFFIIGENACRNPEIIKRIYKEGHTIGNHTYSHIQLSKANIEKAFNEINMTQNIIKKICGVKPEYIRPPFGAWSEKLQEEVNLKPVLWNVDPYDWKVKNSDTIVNSIINQTKDGSIILLHDSYKTSVESAFRVIDILKNKGYRFCTVDEIMIE